MKFADGEGLSVMDKLKLSIGSTNNTGLFNATGHSAMSMPCGFASPEVNDTEAKLPLGMQLVAKRWDEEILLNAAAVFAYSQASLK
jgi:amidase